MTEHRYAVTGRYDCTWCEHHGIVRIRDNSRGGLKVNAWTMEPDLSDVIEMIENEQGEVGPLSMKEVMFLMNMAAAVDTIREFAGYDLEKYGEIGISG